MHEGSFQNATKALGKINQHQTAQVSKTKLMPLDTFLKHDDATEESIQKVRKNPIELPAYARGSANTEPVRQSAGARTVSVHALRVTKYPAHTAAANQRDRGPRTTVAPPF